MRGRRSAEDALLFRLGSQQRLGRRRSNFFAQFKAVHRRVQRKAETDTDNKQTERQTDTHSLTPDHSAPDTRSAFGACVLNFILLDDRLDLGSRHFEGQGVQVYVCWSDWLLL